MDLEFKFVVKFLPKHLEDPLAETCFGGNTMSDFIVPGMWECKGTFQKCITTNNVKCDTVKADKSNAVMDYVTDASFKSLQVHLIV